MWLKLKWARFFTLVRWQWSLSPQPGFDFKVCVPCWKENCSDARDRHHHTLLVRVVNQNRDALEESHTRRFDAGRMYQEPHPALFGDGPDNAVWQMAHGDGGGCYELSAFIPNGARLWERANHE
jgi:hypothetical protein